MAVKNTFYDSVGGIASGEGLVHIEMTQRKDFNTENKEAQFEVSDGESPPGRQKGSRDRPQ